MKLIIFFFENHIKKQKVYGRNVLITQFNKEVFIFDFLISVLILGLIKDTS